MCNEVCNGKSGVQRSSVKPFVVIRGRSRRYRSGVRFDRISADHRIMGGLPCIAGTRIPVATVVSLVAEGESAEQIVDEFPQLEVDDVRQALQYAAAAVRERRLPLRFAAEG